MLSPACGLLQPLAPALSSIRRNARCAQRTLINCHVGNARVFEEVRAAILFGIVPQALGGILIPNLSYPIAVPQPCSSVDSGLVNLSDPLLLLCVRLWLHSPRSCPFGQSSAPVKVQRGGPESRASQDARNSPLSRGVTRKLVGAPGPTDLVVLPEAVTAVTRMIPTRRPIE